MKTYRIEELAKLARTTVRNVRAYQDRGILPPPRREGRIAWYSDSHLARLRVVSALLEKGYSIANIAELLATWESGGELRELLGFEQIVMSPFTDEEPVPTTLEEIIQMVGKVTPAHAMKALQTRLVEWKDGELQVPSPRLMRAGAELHRVGVPIDVLLDELLVLRRDIDAIAVRFVEIVVKYIIRVQPSDLPALEEIARLSDIVRRIRPLAATIVSVQLAQALEKRVRTLLGDHFSTIFERPLTKRSPPRR